MALDVGWSLALAADAGAEFVAPPRLLAKRSAILDRIGWFFFSR